MASGVTLMNKLAPLLGGTIIHPFTHAPNITYIAMPAGWWLWIGEAGHCGPRSRAAMSTHNPVINGMSDHLWNPDRLEASIGFSASKPLDRIAADLKKRLIPQCDRLWQNVISVRDDRDAVHSKIESTIAKLVAAMPDIDYQHRDRSRERGSGHLEHPRSKYLSKAYVRQDETVDLELQHIPLAMALAILSSINDLRKD